MERTRNLLPHVAGGDQAAVGLVIERYGGLIATLANRYCKNPQDAEDAIQEVFVELWKNAWRFRPTKGAEVTFVAMIARRRLVDLNRRRRDRPVVDVDVDSLPTTSFNNFANLGNVDGNAELAEQVETAAAFLKTLPGKQRKVILRAIYGGLSHSEVAKETGLPLGTVKTWIRQGLRKLRKELDRINAPKTLQQVSYRKSQSV